MVMVIGPAAVNEDGLWRACKAVWGIEPRLEGDDTPALFVEQLAHEYGHILRAIPRLEAVDRAWGSAEIDALCRRSPSPEWDEVIVAAAVARVMLGAGIPHGAGDDDWTVYCAWTALENIRGTPSLKQYLFEQFTVQLQGARVRSAGLACRIYRSLVMERVLLPHPTPTEKA